MMKLILSSDMSSLSYKRGDQHGCTCDFTTWESLEDILHLLFILILSFKCLSSYLSGMFWLIFIHDVIIMVEYPILLVVILLLCIEPTYITHNMFGCSCWLQRFVSLYLPYAYVFMYNITMSPFLVWKLKLWAMICWPWHVLKLFLKRSFRIDWIAERIQAYPCWERSYRI